MGRVEDYTSGFGIENVGSVASFDEFPEIHTTLIRPTCNAKPSPKITNLQRPGNSLDDSELARKIVHRWEEALSEVRQAYKQFLGSVVVSEEFREVAKFVYNLFGRPEEEYNNTRRISEKKEELQKLLGYNVPDVKIQKVASLAQRLFILQPSGHEAATVSEAQVDGGKVDLRWLREECDHIVNRSGSQLSGDELAMTLCQVLDSDKAVDEIAGDLLDLVGDSAFETVQDLLKHRAIDVDAIRHGLVVLKSEKMTPNSQPRMPRYGTQVTIQTESEKQIDKLRRKEEKRHRRGTELGVEHGLSAGNFSSLLQASERKGLFDDLIGSGQGPNSFSVSSLPQGTARKHFKGYEEVSIPPTPTAQLKPGENLVPFISFRISLN
ncbi:hypothetical protein BVC80_8285g13 [Macleaya cordata]|uniref:DExH14 plug domain-containing protein n=1 Tax=Macleaya cordata TaxID=56857 RepID=A0A200QRN3_MACCD|nr:hypothetical protein BVC80_8285g13 [Macleaya cordata]